MNMTSMSPNWPTGFRIGLLGHAAPNNPSGIAGPGYSVFLRSDLTCTAIPVGLVVELFLNRLMTWFFDWLIKNKYSLIDSCCRRWWQWGVEVVVVV